LRVVLTAYFGQIVRWDMNAVWSVVVTAKMAGHVPLIGTRLAHFIIGGDVVGSYTLSRIFDLHVIILPMLLASLVGLHVYLVLRNGISEPPVPGRGVDSATYRSDYHDMLRKEGVPFWPTVVLRDFAFALGVVLVVLLLAWVDTPVTVTLRLRPLWVHSGFTWPGRATGHAMSDSGQKGCLSSPL